MERLPRGRSHLKLRRSQSQSPNQSQSQSQSPHQLPRPPGVDGGDAARLVRRPKRRTDRRAAAARNVWWDLLAARLRIYMIESALHSVLPALPTYLPSPATCLLLPPAFSCLLSAFSAIPPPQWHYRCRYGCRATPDRTCKSASYRSLAGLRAQFKRKPASLRYGQSSDQRTP
jgi:hypothetical protein